MVSLLLCVLTYFIFFPFFSFRIWALDEREPRTDLRKRSKKKRNPMFTLQLITSVAVRIKRDVRNENNALYTIRQKKTIYVSDI